MDEYKKDKCPSCDGMKYYQAEKCMRCESKRRRSSLWRGDHCEERIQDGYSEVYRIRLIQRGAAKKRPTIKNNTNDCKICGDPVPEKSNKHRVLCEKLECYLTSQREYLRWYRSMGYGKEECPVPKCKNMKGKYADTCRKCWGKVKSLQMKRDHNKRKS